MFHIKVRYLNKSQIYINALLATQLNIIFQLFVLHSLPPGPALVGHDLEGGEDLVLLVDYDHLRLPVHIGGYELAVVTLGDVACSVVACFNVGPPNEHTAEEQMLSVHLGDIRELGEVNTIAVSKSFAF